MLCAVTVRMIKPGGYESFRRAWEPEPWPPQLARVLVTRNEQNPDQVLTASFFDLSAGALDAARDDTEVLEAEESRLRRIAEYEDAVVFKGIFEVVEDLGPGG